MQGEVAYRQGDTLQAYRMLHQALTALRPHRNSLRLHQALMKLAEWASAEGMPRAAMRIQDADVAVARRTDHRTNAPEALLARARIRAFAGHTALAIADVDSADALIAGFGVKHWTQQARYTRAVVAPEADAPRYAAELDSAVRYFVEERNVFWLLPALLRRADLRLAADDQVGADADLDAVTARIRTTAWGTKDFHLRAAIIEQARRHFDRRVMLHVRNDRAREALEAFERGRISVAPTGGESAAPALWRPVAPGHVAVTYALIGDTLLTWTVTGSSVRMLKRHVSRGELLSTIQRAGAALATRSRAALAEPHLNRLHEWLIRPLLPDLGPENTPLSILADGEIAGVPFALLRAGRGERYLIEDHSLRFVTTLADAAAPDPAPPPADPRVLLVADPAFDPASHLTLDRLKGAGAEVESLRSVYPRADVLRDSGATREAMAARARGAGVIHFAGHAVFDDTQPERSFLVLARDGRLSADSAGTLDLRGVRLVVLSACRTLPSRTGRSDGIAGLSGGLLSAGAGGVVGSLWQVDDRLTQPLMLAFHREYRQAGRSPAEALRRAQIAMLRSGDPARSSPASWAGFRYIGR